MSYSFIVGMEEMINGYEAILQNKGNVRMMMIKDGTHFAIATHYKQIIGFLNKEIGLLRL